MCVALVAGCGGTSWKTAGPAPSSTTTTPTTIEDAEARAWIAAAVHGLLNDPNLPPGVTATDATCVARALVDTVTVARLTAAGATLADMRNPDYVLPPSVDANLPDATRLALGARLQTCGLGRLLGSAFSEGIAQAVGTSYRPDASTVRCLNRAFDAPAQRALVAHVVLASDPTTPEAHDIAEILVDCLDFGALFASSLHTTLSPAERSCIQDEARADTGLVDGITNEIIGGSTGDAQSTQLELFGIRAMKCLTPEHILHLAPNGAKSD